MRVGQKASHRPRTDVRGTWVTAQPDGRPATNPGRSPTAIAFGQRHERASAQKLSATSDVVQATASSTRSQTSPYATGTRIAHLAGTRTP